MIRLYVRHTVSDYAKWKKVYDAFDKKSANIEFAEVYQSVENPKDVTVALDFKKAETAREFSKSEKLRKAMKESGVTNEPTMWIAKSA